MSRRAPAPPAEGGASDADRPPPDPARPGRESDRRLALRRTGLLLGALALLAVALELVGRVVVHVVGDTATGRTGGIYRDLSIQFVDRASGEGGVFKGIKSFFANAFALEGSNVPGEGDSLRVGVVAHTFQPGDPIYAVIWLSIRSGLMDLAGL